MVTQNVDRLHHRAGSNPLGLHGSVYEVICLECGTSISRESFQEEVKKLNPNLAVYAHLFLPHRDPSRGDFEDLRHRRRAKPHRQLCLKLTRVHSRYTYRMLSINFRCLLKDDGKGVREPLDEVVCVRLPWAHGTYSVYLYYTL